jgi:hypothetical protein
MPRPFETGPDGLNGQLARDGYFVVAEAGRLAKQEHVTIDVTKSRQRLANGESQLLHRRLRGIRFFYEHSLAPRVAYVIEREIAGDAEYPRAPARRVRVGHTRARHSQEHLLRQVVRFFRPAHDAAQVAEDALAVLGEKDVGVRHGSVW